MWFVVDIARMAMERVSGFIRLVKVPNHDPADLSIDEDIFGSGVAVDKTKRVNVVYALLIAVMMSLV